MGDRKGDKKDKQNREIGMEGWLERYPPRADAFLKDDIDPNPRGRTPRSSRLDASSVRGLRRMAHQEELDLHGHTVVEAKAETDAFLRRCYHQGLRKVLIIHGKGSHRESEGKLRREIRAYLQTHPLTGRLLEPDGRNGGHGAIWVVLRR